jgi:L-seryl-tRNA(Ser) seleniumtransferase
MRPDKMALAALSATLLAYVRGDAETTLPLWRMIAAPVASIESRAKTWQIVANRIGISVDLVPGESTVGGGSLPGETLPTCLVVLPSWIRAGMLRSGPVAVIGRTRGNRVHLDPRTVLETQEDALFATLRHIAASLRDENAVIDSAT